MRWIFKITGVIPVSAAKAREAITKAADHIAAGEIVCIFPEGAISRTGAMQGLKRGFELIARRSKESAGHTRRTGWPLRLHLQLRTQQIL